MQGRSLHASQTFRAILRGTDGWIRYEGRVGGGRGEAFCCTGIGGFPHHRCLRCRQGAPDSSTPLGKRVRWCPLDGGVRRTVVALLALRWCVWDSPFSRTFSSNAAWSTGFLCSSRSSKLELRVCCRSAAEEVKNKCR